MPAGSISFNRAYVLPNRILLKRSSRTAIAKSTKSYGTSMFSSQQNMRTLTMLSPCRVLRKPGGVFIYLTFGQPHFRKRYLTRPGTSLEVRALGEAFHYYLYILRA